MLEIFVSIGVTLLGVAVVWGALKNQVANNNEAIKRNTEALEELTKKQIPLERENAMAEATIIQLKELMVDMKSQICELRDVVQTLLVEVEVLKAEK